MTYASGAILHSNENPLETPQTLKALQQLSFTLPQAHRPAPPSARCSLCILKRNRVPIASALTRGVCQTALFAWGGGRPVESGLSFGGGSRRQRPALKRSGGSAQTPAAAGCSIARRNWASTRGRASPASSADHASIKRLVLFAAFGASEENLISGGRAAQWAQMLATLRISNQSD